MKAKIMGIVNLTGDSFYPPSRTLGIGEKALLERVEAMIDDGADILDLGAVSSRPGADLVPEAEEWTRLEPALRAIRDAFPAVELSIDTFRSGIVRRAAAIAGDIIVNDIFAGSADEKMIPTVEDLGLRYIAMHIRGSWQTMHDNYVYDDVTAEVRAYFEDFARRANGLREWWMDPRRFRQGLHQCCCHPHCKRGKRALIQDWSPSRCSRKS